MAIKNPTRKELKEVTTRKPVFKVVSVTERRGKEYLYSLIIGAKKGLHSTLIGDKRVLLKRLRYVAGKITKGGEYGVWCCKTYKSALYQQGANGHHVESKIFSAIPLGEEIRKDTIYNGAGVVLYPSIILGTEVNK